MGGRDSRKGGVQGGRAEGLAVAARGDASDVWHGGDGTEGFRRLGVGDDLAVGGVDTGEVGVFGVAGFENLVLGGVGGVEGASDTVVDVLAVVGGIGTGGVTCFEAEGVGSEEAVRKFRGYL